MVYSFADLLKLTEKFDLFPTGFKSLYLFVLSFRHIPQLFDIFIRKREHIALVVDEYGSVSGLVTMEDIIETLLGMEIMDESDNVEDLQQLARKTWEDRAKRLGIIE